MRLYGRWKVSLPGEEYVWEPDETTVSEELMLEGEHGLSFDEWVEAVDERKAIPCQVLVWFLRRKAGRQEDRMSVDFPIRRLATEQLDEDADPEAPAVSETATEPSSPASTESVPGSSNGSPVPILS